MLSSSHYLSAMGIQQWELIHPERLAGFESAKQSLAQDCRLLLVASEPPQGSEILFLERILKSFQLELAMVRYITPSQLNNLAYNGLEWIWFAGCDPQSHHAQKQLHSPRLAEIDGHTQYRRDLWQQICAYQGSAS
ncbi:DNA polymerase III psi subunit [Vibrio sp. RC586]|uniref:DNA polymerase III subunit psi n=1 Tax=Vibrio sp. RC586 TaxID=675815 RepID=UPI0001BB82EB|nr:DNA polymerase III subunit psi [Vibrio sp. RC586]EEZ01192.1 DNA polymerase III psi subunit [Vibrio sp. RC586]